MNPHVVVSTYWWRVERLRRAVNNVNKMQEEEYLFLQLFSVFVLLLLLL